MVKVLFTINSMSAEKNGNLSIKNEVLQTPELTYWINNKMLILVYF